MWKNKLVIYDTWSSSYQQIKYDPIFRLLIHGRHDIKLDFIYLEFCRLGNIFMN